MYTIDDIIQYIHNVDKELSVEQTSNSKIRLYGHTGRNHKSSKQRFKFELDVELSFPETITDKDYEQFPAIFVQLCKTACTPHLFYYLQETEPVSNVRLRSTETEYVLTFESNDCLAELIFSQDDLNGEQLIMARPRSATVYIEHEEIKIPTDVQTEPYHNISTILYNVQKTTYK